MNAAPDMITTGLKMTVALGMVLVLMVFLLYGLRRLAGQRLGRAGGKHIHVLENHYLGVKKSIALVQVPGKVLVLGLSADRVNLLDTIDESHIDLPPAKKEASTFGSLLNGRLMKDNRRNKGKDAS